MSQPPLDPLAVIQGNAQQSPLDDKLAEQERTAMQGGNYAARDEEDSYGVRKAIKGQVEKHAAKLFYFILAVIWVSLVLLVVMISIYIWHLSHNPKEIADVISSMVSHVMAGAVGFFAWAYWGKIKK